MPFAHCLSDFKFRQMCHKKPSKNVVDILRLKRKLKNIFKCDLDIKPKWLTHLRQKSLKNLEDMERQRRLKQLAFKRAFDLEPKLLTYDFCTSSQ